MTEGDRLTIQARSDEVLESEVLKTGTLLAL
jgi:hypothetical protein